MRAFVIGGDGLVGRNLAEALTCGEFSELIGATTRRHHELIGVKTIRPYLDLSKPEDFTYPPGELDTVYMVAAVTKVVDCEADPATTWRINADAPVQLALKLPLKTQVVFISSDAVERAPNLNYSKQKAYVESFVLARGGVVVRPSRIPPDKVDGLVNLLIHLGHRNKVGLFRWSP